MRIRGLLALGLVALAACSGVDPTTTTVGDATTVTAVSTSSTTTVADSTSDTSAGPADLPAEVTAITKPAEDAPTNPSAPEDSTPPAKPTGISVRLGGGSLEALVTWEPNTEPDLHHYDAYYSETAGGAKTKVRTVVAGTVWQPEEDQPGFIHFPVSQTNGRSCYQIVAVDNAGNESDRSSEACFSQPPVVVP